MSLGFEGYAKYKEERDGYLIYEYSGANWNVTHEKESHFLHDGLISIEKNLLNEEEWVSELDKGRIKIIKECKNAFYRYEMKFDYIAIRIILHISKEYKKTGKLPQRVSFIQ